MHLTKVSYGYTRHIELKYNDDYKRSASLCSWLIKSLTVKAKRGVLQFFSQNDFDALSIHFFN